LKESLEKFGLVEPIIFNKQTGWIVGGHFRVRELIKLGVKEVECVIVDLNEDDEMELNIRLNANTGSWDWDTLANDWEVVDLEKWGLDIPQFDTVEEEVIEEEQEKMNVIELKFYNKDYKIVKEKLNSISMSPEIAVLKLLGVE
jgi:ParB-like chromosome segregation protein Spo0J